MTFSICADSSVFVRVAMYDLPDLTFAFKELLMGDRSIVAPELIHFEVVNSLWKYVRAGTIKADQCRRMLSAFLDLPVRLEDDDLFYLEASDMANRGTGLTGYDAYFVVVALRTAAELWTCDRHLASLANENGVIARLWTP